MRDVSGDEARSPVGVAGACLVLAVSGLACATREVTVEFYTTDDHEFSSGERRLIHTIAEATAVEVRHLLPALPRQLVLRVRAGDEVIEETGETASARPPHTVYWIVDPRRPGGVTAVAELQLRRTLFHEFHHLVRDASVERSSIMDAAISEGLATVFERDHAGAPAPWGRYPAEVSDWVKELMALPDTAPRDRWMFRHPDGRRWIAFKVGTFLADRAIRASSRSSAELVSATTDDVLAMAMSP